MMFTKIKFNLGNEILFVAFMILLYTPNQYKLAGLCILCFSLITAAVIDWRKNTKRVRRITRRVRILQMRSKRDDFTLARASTIAR